jgi:methyl-accepting chemotaxis protein
MFNWFNNMRMGTKLLVSFITLAVVVAGAVGGLGYYNLTNTNNLITEIVQQRVPSVKNATAVERYALRTIMDEKMYLLYQDAQYQQAAMSNIDQINTSLDAVDTVAKKYNDQDLLSQSQQVRTVTAQYKDLYNQGVAKLQANKAAATTMNDKGQVVVTQAQAYFQAKLTDTTDQGKQALTIVVDIWDTALQTRLHEKNYMLNKDPQEFKGLSDNITKLGTLYDNLQKVTTSTDDLNRIATARTATTDYYTAAQAWVTNDNDLQAILKQMATIGTTVQDNATKAEDAGWTATEASQAKATAVYTTAIQFTVGAVVAAILIGIVLGLFVSRTITHPLGILVSVGKSLSKGDLVRDLSDGEKDKVRLRQDEIGDIGQAFDRLINYLQGMGAAARQIAEGDLTVETVAQSAKDELGQAFIQMVTGLRESVTQVKDSAANVSAASEQLAAASEQAGSATSQQTEATTKTASSVEEMKKAIDGVA